MSLTTGRDDSISDQGAPGAVAATAEAKRMAARRRFLLGGATALPMIVTLGQKQAWAASAGVCQSLGLAYDDKYARKGAIKGQLQASMFCDPNTRW